MSLFVMIEREADAQDVAAHIGDAVAGLQLRRPSLRVRGPEGEEAGVAGPVQLLGATQRVPPSASSRCSWSRVTCAEIRAVVSPFSHSIRRTALNR